MDEPVGHFGDGEPKPCQCVCHQHPPGMIKHVMACCLPCDRCGKLFASGLVKHREICDASG